MAEAIVDGIRLAYDVEGDGQPVVLLNALGMRRIAWSLGLAPLLMQAGYTVITYDHRGSGDSDAPAGPYTVSGLGRDLAGLIDHLGVGPCRVVGYSFGGFVAQQLAVDRPDLVQSLTLLASAGRMTAFGRLVMESGAQLARLNQDLPEASAIIEALVAVLAPAQLQDDALVTQQIERMKERPAWRNPGRLATFEAALTFIASQSDALSPAIACPLFVIAFEHDVAFAPRAGHLAAATIESSEFVEIRGAGHGGALTHAPLVAEHLINFFSRT